LNILFTIGIFSFLSATTIFGIRLVQVLSNPDNALLIDWETRGQATRRSLIADQPQPCAGAPFIVPTAGFSGLLYAYPRGPYSKADPHQGIDIFSSNRIIPGIEPVYAASDGFITRESDWVSSLIQRVPSDRFRPQRQLWLYYTHMADRDGNDYIIDEIPPGTSELFVSQGSLIGYIGNYNGGSPRPIWTHLHFSIVKDDGFGNYLNELDFNNTVYPTPYLGLPVDFQCLETEEECPVPMHCV
jgi:murein DD-endopeptidase MepM/ murein hydrolase activator NlpD